MNQPAAPRRKRGRPPIEGLAERRRQEILTVAIEQFAANGYDNTDLQNVAAILGVGKGTLYRYFPSKRQMFEAALDRIVAEMRQAMDQSIQAEQDPFAQLAAATRAYLTFFGEHPSYVELIMQERADPREGRKPTYFAHREVALRRWQDFYRGLIAAGKIRNVPVERITDVMCNAIYGTMCTNYFSGPAKSPAEQAEDILDVALHGLLTEQEAARLRAACKDKTKCQEGAAC
jgi:AcrR family transcriptional regulator